jgi:hypothetical protein
MAHGPAYLPSEGIIKDIVIRDAVSVSSSDGEMILLHEKVNTLISVAIQTKRETEALAHVRQATKLGTFSFVGYCICTVFCL